METYWAQIDENSIVVRVISVLGNSEESSEWVSNNLDGRWLETDIFSVEGNKIEENGILEGGAFRGNYANVGYFYDKDLDAFIPPKPFNSWILDTSKFSWKSPVENPNNQYCCWDEDTLSWKTGGI